MIEVKKIHLGEDVIGKDGRPGTWLRSDAWAILENGRILEAGYDAKWIAEMIVRNKYNSR